MSGLPYLVAVRPEDEAGTVMDAYGPVDALNPKAAVGKAAGHLPDAYDADKTIEVYPVGVDPDGGVECIEVDTEVLAE